MAEGTAAMAFYGSQTSENILDATVAACEEADFTVAPENRAGGDVVENELGKITVECDQWRFDLHFEDDPSPDAPVLMIGCGQKIYPSSADDEAEYQRKMTAMYELLCRLAMAINSDYAPLFNPSGRSAMPTGTDIIETLAELPRMAVYSPEALDSAGGLEALYQTEPWYTATLSDGKIVVVETQVPWADGGWRPPTDADFIESASFAEPQSDEGTRRGFSDPFAELEMGDYGVDVCVPRTKISTSFPKEDLEPVRVYVDENRDLRTVDADTFVRNIVDEDPGDDMAFIKAMLSDMPADADPDKALVSTLLDGQIPASFVSLEAPAYENVVTAVMDLDTDVNKVKLLQRLSQLARQGGVSEADLQEIVEMLDDVAPENIDQYIVDRLQ